MNVLMDPPRVVRMPDDSTLEAIMSANVCLVTKVMVSHVERKMHVLMAVIIVIHRHIVLAKRVKVKKPRSALPVSVKKVSMAMAKNVLILMSAEKTNAMSMLTVSIPLALLVALVLLAMTAMAKNVLISMSAISVISAVCTKFAPTLKDLTNVLVQWDSNHVTVSVSM